MAEMQNPNPELGDLIEMFRDSIQHWAVYIGNNKVIHFTTVADTISKSDSSSHISQAYSNVSSHNNSGSSNTHTFKGIVKIELLDRVVGNSKWKINNMLDGTHKPRSAEDIVSDALAMVGDETEYDIFSWNCEHFVTKLRYGIAISKQADNGVYTTNVVIGTSLAVSASGLIISSNNST